MTGPAENRVREALRSGSFFWTIEFVPHREHLDGDLVVLDSFVSELAGSGEIAAFSVTDRVTSEQDPDPVQVAETVLRHSSLQPLVHLSGKDRQPEQLCRALDRAAGQGLENLLLISGDRLRGQPPEERRPYLESVAALALARRHDPRWLLGCALNPFKYVEAAGMAQYLKLERKLDAGADFVITQIGFDSIKHEEAIYWLDAHRPAVPLVANLMTLGLARARYLRAHPLAGVIVPEPWLHLLEAEARELTPQQAAARVTRRLALQIVGLRLLGYSGVQLSNIRRLETLRTLRRQVEYLGARHPDRVSWSKAWLAALRPPGGGPVRFFVRGWYLTDPRPPPGATRDLLRYRVMRPLHRWLFDRGPLSALLRRLLAPVRRHGRADRLLVRIERAVKAPLFGCRVCGYCRLGETQYICPERCPKGLANGACGGTDGDTCEFGDRTCIHSRRYRVAARLGRTGELAKGLVPPVPESIRGSSSWPPHFRGEQPPLECRR